MLSYKYDLSLTEQTKLDALIDGKDMETKVVLLVDEEFEIVNKEMFDRMNKQAFGFEVGSDGDIITDIHYCELLKRWASCATLTFSDNTVSFVDVHLAVCIFYGDFDVILLDK